MEKHIKHVRHHAERHHEAHLNLKKLIKNYNPLKEKFWITFLITFFITLISIIIFRNWGNIINFVQNKYHTAETKNIIKTSQILPASKNSNLITSGVKTGAQAVYSIDEQAGINDKNILNSILTFGSIKSAQTNSSFGEAKGIKSTDIGSTLKNSVWITNYLSTGQHLTKIQADQARALQKSVLSTYYFGEKTVDIDSALQTDAQILGKIKNTLSVDLFQYLNQSANRSNSLDEYLKLLKTLYDKSVQRIADLQEKITFLEANSATRSTDIKTSEKTFFDNMKIFDGIDADKELKKFIGLKDDYTEIRAKLGAYKNLQGYYKYFLPKLSTMIKAVQANRDVLIAGVKVTEIQNMTLPLVIKTK